MSPLKKKNFVQLKAYKIFVERFCNVFKVFEISIKFCILECLINFFANIFYSWDCRFIRLLSRIIPLLSQHCKVFKLLSRLQLFIPAATQILQISSAAVPTLQVYPAVVLPLDMCPEFADLSSWHVSADTPQLLARAEEFFHLSG